MDYTNPLWFKEVLEDDEHKHHINTVIDIKNYLLRVHKVLERKDFQFKEETLKTAKTILNTLKSIINFHVSYCVGNPISINGDREMVKALNTVYKKGSYTKTDYDVCTDLIKYGNAYEYVFADKDGVIKSKVIANEDSYPIFDDEYNYVAFVEQWQNNTTSVMHDVVYYPDKVAIFADDVLIETKVNLTGLPILYVSMDESAFTHFGDSMMLDLIPIMDEIENLLSKMTDSITVLSLNPLGISTGQRIDGTISKDAIGATINLEYGGDFKYANALLDYNSIKLLLDSLTQQLYVVAGVPSAIMGQSNISNVSEVSLKLLYQQTDNKAKQNIQVLKSGLFMRFAYIRKLLEKNGVKFSDEIFDTLDMEFSLNRPVDTNSLMDELKTQYDMGAISIESIIEKSPHTVNVGVELERLAKENVASATDQDGTVGTEKTEK
ncbi:MAG: phage portal protein [Oscillospiraceae bacterium]